MVFDTTQKVLSVRIAKTELGRLQVFDKVPAINAKPEYPHVWFNAHKVIDDDGKIIHIEKPPLKIPILKPEDIKEARRHVYMGLVQGNLDVNLAKAYIYRVINNEKIELKEDWTSWDRVIGRKGDLISLSEMFAVTDDDVNYDSTTNPTAVDEKEDKWMLLCITAVHRLTALDMPEYMKKVADAGNNLLKKYKAPGIVNLATMAESYGDWNKDAWYPALMSAIDMFLANNPKSKYTQLRFGTIINRFRDCSVLMDLVLLRDISGMDYSEIARWIWTRRLAEDYTNSLLDGEEIDVYWSYTPYFMGLELARKSPYGTALNPSLHLWIHIISATMGYTRSLNARLVGTPDLAGVPPSAMVLAYVLLTVLNFQAQYNENGQEEMEDDIIEVIKTIAEKTEETGLPEVADPELWLGYIKDHGNRVPTVIQNFCWDIWAVIKKPRKGTIGALLQEYAKKAGRTINPEDEPEEKE